MKDTAFLTTLAGYVHWKLIGGKVLGVGDTSGMFLINNMKNDYDNARMEQFENLVVEKGYSWKLRDLPPKVLPAGGAAGKLMAEGA